MSHSHPEPATGFTKFNLCSALQRGIAAAGFVEPRPIQSQTIPAALAGRDVLGLARTGTGKTAAFALPVLERLLAKPGAGPRVLIVVPTRELANQICGDIRTLAGFTRVAIATVFGGVSAQTQRAALRARPDIVVACPGRLLDLHRQGTVVLDRIEVLVLDEADHMFDMGFLPDVRRILSALPKKRQTLMFSATMPAEIRTLAARALHDPLVVELVDSRPPDTIEHALYPTHGEEKLALLEHVLAGDAFTSAIVFTRTKHRAKRLAQQLARVGHRAVALQGDMSQVQRDRAMTGFRQRRFDILVATDLAARGLDVEGVSHVVNFDMPGTPDAYTHRIGRTGRAERAGKAYTFVTADDLALVREVERRMGAPIVRRSIAAGGAPARPGSPKLCRTGDAGSGRGRRPRGRWRMAVSARAGEAKGHAMGGGWS